jgi:hypothetical protein
MSVNHICSTLTSFVYKRSEVPVANIKSRESLPTEKGIEDDPDGELMENQQSQQQARNTPLKCSEVVRTCHSLKSK